MFYELQSLFEYFLLILAVFFFGWLVFSRPKMALAFLFFALPSYLVKIKIGLLTLTLLDLFFLVLIAIFGFSWLKNNFWRRALQRQGTKWLVGFWLLGLVLSLIAKDSLSALGGFKSLILLPSLALWLMKEKGFLKSPCLRRYLTSFFFSGLAVALIASTCKILGFLTWDGRLAALWQSPNQLGMFLGMVFLAGVALFLEKGCSLAAGKRKLSFLFLSGLILPPLLFSYSAGAFVSLLAALILGAVFMKTKNRLAASVLFSGLYLTALSWLIFFGNKLSFLGESFFSRLDIWRAAKKIIAENFFTGIGFSNFQEYYLNFQRYFPAYREWAVPHAHSLWLDAILNLGIAGLLAFILIFLGWLGWIVKKAPSFESLERKRENKKTGRETVFFVFLFFYLLVYGLVDEPVFRNDLVFLLWLAIFQISSAYKWLSYPLMKKRKSLSSETIKEEAS